MTRVEAKIESVAVREVESDGGGMSVEWGSFGVPYFIYLELKGNMLRNAADKFLRWTCEKHTRENPQWIVWSGCLILSMLW